MNPMNGKPVDLALYRKILCPKCQSEAWIPVMLMGYMIHRFKPNDRNLDLQIPLATKWACAACGRTQLLEDLNGQAGPRIEDPGA